MDGILSIIKPPGITSHDVISILRRLLKERRLGHSGTLDPMAAGVLPVYFGRATRLIEQSDTDVKTYVAEGIFGYHYDTEDLTGNIVAGEGAEAYATPSMEEIEKLCASFVGDIEQKPSIYSAIKVDGKRAYELAREGKEVDLPARKVIIYECSLLAYAYPHVTLRITCSGGTYVRALLRDLGEALKIPCAMAALLRVSVGPYTLLNSYSLEEVEAGNYTLLPVSQGVEHMTRVDLSLKDGVRLSQGQVVRHLGTSIGICQVWADGSFLGLGEQRENELVAKKIIYPVLGKE